jgi:hypothetical protein
MRAALLLPLFLLLGCRKATVVDYCADDPDDCLTCESDADCSFQGNDCTESVICAHDATGLSFIQIGCSEALTYSWPDDADCACVEGACSYTGD